MKLSILTLPCASLVVMTILGGCGGSSKEDTDMLAPPPAAPKTAAVSLDKSTSAPPLANPLGTNNLNPALPPATTPEGLAAITKGLTPDQIKEFKETASIETHDTQINLISDAANSFYNDKKRAPKSVEELVQTGFLPKLLVAPKGKKYVINPDSLAVTAVTP